LVASAAGSASLSQNGNPRQVFGKRLKVSAGDLPGFRCADMIAGPVTELLDRDFLSRVLGREVHAGRYTTLKQDGLPSAVYRIEVQESRGKSHYLIVKLVERDWPGDDEGHLREAHFYREIARRLTWNGPPVYYAGLEPAGERHIIVMADCSRTHRFLPATHAWTLDELRPALTAYARLHAGSRELRLSPTERAPLIPRLEERVRRQASALPGMIAELADLGVWPLAPEIEPALGRFLEEMAAYEALPASVLHLDFTPGNVGLPVDPLAQAIIVDWEMASWGLPEIDLSYVFTQPYGNARFLEREQLLTAYWHTSEELGLDAPTPSQQRERLRYAERLWTLWLIPVARRVARQPFAPGTAPAIYWQKMFPLLYDRLLNFDRAG